MIRLNHKAFVMPSVIITSLFLTTMAIIITELSVSNFRIAIEDRARLQSQLSADAGLDYGIAALNNDSSWAGTGGEQLLDNNGVTRSTYEVAATIVDSDTISLSSIGRSYEPTSATTPKHEREFIVELRGIGSATGSYSVVTGVGGLILSNSAKIVAGDVFVNGTIDMSNSSQIGTTTNTVRIDVAHQSCPTSGGSTYPSLCTSGNPISTSNTATIYGEVCARNQTDGSGMTNTGLNPSCSGTSPTAPTPQPLPTHDRDAQKAAVSNTINGDYVCNSNSAQWTLPANTRITGNMDVTKKCEITILGDLWVEGDMIFSGKGELIVPDSLGTTIPNVMVDGAGGIGFSNSSQIIGNAQNTGAQVLTYWSNAACSPDCADVTGNDLFNSQNDVTIYFSNSAKAPETILYARWSRIEMNNGGDIGALIGQTVYLHNSAAVTFGASVGTGSGSGQTWLIDSYRRNQ